MIADSRTESLAVLTSSDLTADTFATPQNPTLLLTLLSHPNAQGISALTSAPDPRSTPTFRSDVTAHSAVTTSHPGTVALGGLTITTAPALHIDELDLEPSPSISPHLFWHDLSDPCPPSPQSPTPPSEEGFPTPPAGTPPHPDSCDLQWERQEVGSPHLSFHEEAYLCWLVDRNEERVCYELEHPDELEAFFQEENTEVEFAYVRDVLGFGLEE